MAKAAASTLTPRHRFSSFPICVIVLASLFFASTSLALFMPRVSSSPENFVSA